MPYPRFHSCSLRDSSEFKRGSIKTTVKGTVHLIQGELKETGEWETLSIRYPKDKWTEDEARTSCEDKGGTFEAAVKEKTNVRQVTFVQNAANAREETIGETRYLVAPVVLLVEGVHNKYLYTAEEIARSADAWNGRPVVIEHPKRNGEYASARSPEVFTNETIGFLFNVLFDEDKSKLRGEIWIEIEKAKQKDAALLSAIRNGTPLEVSTGLFTNDDGVPGKWHEEEFSATLSDYDPDHFALLPKSVGACSFEDGCGVRANELRIASTTPSLDFDGIEDKPWPNGATDFLAYQGAYYAFTMTAKPEGGLAASVADAAPEIKKWIASKTLGGDPDAMTESSLIAMPVVSSASNKLNKAALQAISDNAIPETVAAEVAEVAQATAKTLLSQHFGSGSPDTDIHKTREQGASTVSPPPPPPPGDEGVSGTGRTPDPRSHSNRKENSMKGTIARFLQRVGLMADEEMSDDEKREKLDGLIQDTAPRVDQPAYKWVVQVYDDYFVYAVTVNGKRTLYKQSYATTDSGPALAGDATEVVEKREYVPAEASAGEITPKQEVVLMENKKQVDALIACERTKFVECDRAWLEKLTPEQLVKLEAEAPEAPTPPEPPKTLEEFVKTAPEELKPQVIRTLEAAARMDVQEKAQKDVLVKKLVENKRCEFTKEELEGKDLKDLERLVVLSSGERNFGAQAAGTSTAQHTAPPDPEDAYKPAAK